MYKNYFKILDIYNKGVKENDQNILQRLNKNLNKLKDNIETLSIINYVINGNNYIICFEHEISIFNNIEVVKSIEVINL